MKQKKPKIAKIVIVSTIFNFKCFLDGKILDSEELLRS